MLSLHHPCLLTSSVSLWWVGTQWKQQKASRVNVVLSNHKLSTSNSSRFIQGETKKKERTQNTEAWKCLCKGWKTFSFLTWWIYPEKLYLKRTRICSEKDTASSSADSETLWTLPLPFSGNILVKDKDCSAHGMQNQPLSRQIPAHFISHKINPESISACIEMKAVLEPMHKKKALQMPTSESAVLSYASDSFKHCSFLL